MPTPRLLLALAAALPAACVEYNSECTPPIENPDETIFWLAADVPVSRPIVRTREVPLGNAMADAYLEALKSSDTLPKKPVVAFENSGAIRDQGLCLTRTNLLKGEVPRRILRDIVPFSNELAVVELTEKELFGVLEHAVSTISIPGVTPGGQFLQVSAGTSFTVDCDNTPESVTSGVRTPGKRVTSLKLPGREPITPDAATDAKIVVAINSFLAAGGDGFLDLKARADKTKTETGESFFHTQRYTYTLLEEHLHALGPDPGSAARLPFDEKNPRINLQNCD